MARPAAVVLYGDKLRTARERAAISQRELARRAGLNQSNVSRWETTSTLLATATVDKLATALKLPGRASLIDLRDCVWCGKGWASERNPLVRVDSERWAHRLVCFDALAASTAGVAQ